MIGPSDTYGMSEINPITSTSCEKMTRAGVHHVEHSKKFRDPSFEHLRIYVGNSPIKKHISNTVGVIVVTGSLYVIVDFISGLFVFIIQI